VDPRALPQVRRVRPGQWVALDCLATVLLALVYAVLFKAVAHLHGLPRWAGATLAAVAVLPAAGRRRWPRTVLTLVVTAGSVAIAISSSPVPPLAVAFVIYLIGLRFPRRESLTLLFGALLATTTGFAAFAAGRYADAPSGSPAGLLAASVVLITAAWAIGYAVRQQRAYAAGLAEHAASQAREQLDRARRARSEERLQIARELHDVVAHTMGVIAVQAGVANYVINTQPEEAARALASIEQTSRSALHEMRALLGVLRDEPDARAAGATVAAGATGAGRHDIGLTPAPGLADLDNLLQRSADAGVRAQVTIVGDPVALPAGLDLAAYRVIQEALTNVIKHAGTDTCRIRISYQPTALGLEITDDGNEASRNGSVPAGGGCVSEGHGLVGMRERISMYGGRFDAAPRPKSGFAVTAWFPLDGEAL
jgi:signal transduction histidine kinase